MGKKKKKKRRRKENVPPRLEITIVGLQSHISLGKQKTESLKPSENLSDP